MSDNTSKIRWAVQIGALFRDRKEMPFKPPKLMHDIPGWHYRNCAAANYFQVVWGPQQLSRQNLRALRDLVSQKSNSYLVVVKLESLLEWALINSIDIHFSNAWLWGRYEEENSFLVKTKDPAAFEQGAKDINAKLFEIGLSDAESCNSEEDGYDEYIEYEKQNCIKYERHRNELVIPGDVNLPELDGSVWIPFKHGAEKWYPLDKLGDLVTGHYNVAAVLEALVRVLEENAPLAYESVFRALQTLIPQTDEGLKQCLLHTFRNRHIRTLFKIIKLCLDNECACGKETRVKIVKLLLTSQVVSKAVTELQAKDKLFETKLRRFELLQRPEDNPELLQRKNKRQQDESVCRNNKRQRINIH